MTDPQDLFDSQASSSEPIWEQELDRRRLVGNAIMATVGAAFLAGPAAEAVASRGAIASPSLRTGSRKAKTSMYVAASGAYQGFNPDKPATIASGPSLANVIACYDSLTDIPIPAQYAAAQKLGKKGYPAVPKLAKSWTVSSDGTVYRLHLRPAVRSSRGNRFTANDVVWSLSKAMNGKFVAAFLLVLCGIAKPDQLKVINPLTLDIHLNAPPPPYFMQILGLPWVPIFDSTEAKKHATSSDPFAQDWLDKNIAGFGPYKQQSNIPGKRSVLVANPNYWGKKPQIKKITQDGIDDSGSRLQLVLTGVADYAEELTPLQLDQVARSSGAAVTNFTSTRVAFLAMNNNKPPFNTPALRQAIARAIPYNDIIKTVYRGRAKRWKTLITPWFQGATDQYWKYETNLAAARAQLASVKGMQVTLSYVQGFGAGQQIAILVQKGLNAAGLNCQLEGLLRAVADQRKVQGGIDFFVDDSDSPAVPSPLYNLQLYFTTTSFQNTLSHYQNPDIDKLAKSLAKNPNLNQQAHIANLAQKILMRDLPFIPIAYTGTNGAHAKSLSGIRSHEIGLPYWQDFHFS